jgi:hypothetical protein
VIAAVAVVVGLVAAYVWTLPEAETHRAAIKAASVDPRAELAAQAAAERDYDSSEKNFKVQAKRAHAADTPVLFTATSTLSHSPEALLGQDAEAKSNARNLVSQVESCAADAIDASYLRCDSPEALGSTGLDYGFHSGQVQVTTSISGYKVQAQSKSGNAFQIIKDGATGVSTRKCVTAGKGGCDYSGSW